MKPRAACRQTHRFNVAAVRISLHSDSPLPELGLAPSTSIEGPSMLSIASSLSMVVVVDGGLCSVEVYVWYKKTAYFVPKLPPRLCLDYVREESWFYRSKFSLQEIFSSLPNASAIRRRKGGPRAAPQETTAEYSILLVRHTQPLRWALNTLKARRGESRRGQQAMARSLPDDVLSQCTSPSHIASHLTEEQFCQQRQQLSSPSYSTHETEACAYRVPAG